MAAAFLPWVTLTVAALFTPRVTRPDLFFSITVNPSFRQSADGREILRRYDRTVIIVALLALLLVGLVRFKMLPLVLGGLLGPMLVEMAGWFGAFLAARRRVAPYHVDPAPQREAVLQLRQVSLPGGWPAQVGPFVILAGIAAWLWLHWDSIPARIPVHWGMNGTPDGWAARSPAAVFGTLAIGLLLCIFLSSLSYAISRGARRIHSSGARATREARFVRVISLVLLGAQYFEAMLMGSLALLALRPHPEAPIPAMTLILLLVEAVFIAAVFVITFRAGQGGWRLKNAGGTASEDSLPVVGDRTPDECWKLGVFYFNRNDPALFVEKRFGIGWTLNFANPRALLAFGAIMLFALAAGAIALVAK